MAKPFDGKYEYDPKGVDHIISERGNMFLALREVRWSAGKDFKLDLRNYRSDEENDIPLKGCSFTDDDADELVSVLIREGFGDNDDIVDVLTSTRPDVCKKMKEVFKEGADMSAVDARVFLYQRRQEYDEEQMAKEDMDDETYHSPERLLED